MTTTLVDAASLGRTLVNINVAQILNQPMRAAQRREAAAFVASRQGLTGSYRGMFGLTDADRAAGRLPLVTGEMPDTGASMSHIAGEECCRALLTLGVKSAAVTRALDTATANFLGYLQEKQTERFTDGYYCCGKCSVALWRHVIAGGMRFSPRTRQLHLVNGLKRLKACRLDNGRWRAFPFFYTLLALTELPPKLARDELAFAAPVCEHLLERSPRGDTTDRVRREIMSRVMATV